MKKVIILIMQDLLEKKGFVDLVHQREFEIAVVSDTYQGDLADYVLNADHKNVDLVITILSQFQKKHHIAGIFSRSEFGIETAAAAAAVLGIPYASPFATIKKTRNKLLTKECLNQNNIPTGEFMIAHCAEDIIEKWQADKYPIIIKPLNGAGSCSVTQINSVQEVKDKFILAEQQRSKMPVNDYRTDTTKGYWLVEEFLKGIEISVECCTFDSDTCVVAIHDKYCDVCEPYFIEKMFVTPSPRISVDLEKEIIEISKRILKALDYTYGMSHIEYVITDQGPRLLEVNARIGGGMLLESVFYSTGINFMETILDIHTGKCPEINIVKREIVAMSLICASKEGVVKEINGFEEVINDPGIVAAEPYTRVGEQVKARQANYGGFLIARGDSYEQIFNCLKKAESKVEFIIE